MVANGDRCVGEEVMDIDLSFRTPNHGYTWSQDYAELLDAMSSGAVVAIVLYDTLRDGTKIFDVCFMLCRPISYKHVEFVASARGIEFFSSRDVQEFLELCSRHEVRFIDPQADNSLLAALESSGIPTQAQGDPSTTPPLRISVTKAREIMEGVENGWD